MATGRKAEDLWTLYYKVFFTFKVLSSLTITFMRVAISPG